jgi:hypothetical protein
MPKSKQNQVQAQELPEDTIEDVPELDNIPAGTDIGKHGNLSSHIMHDQNEWLSNFKGSSCTLMVALHKKE